jgi:2-dehydro-3-deoxygalactonokinase
MDNVGKSDEDLCAIYVDMGTTNTRAWLVRGNDVLAHASKPVGVRDSARSGSTTRIRTTLIELIGTVQEQTNDISESGRPACIAAAGMIGSALGLAEVPHVPTPAGLQEIAAATLRIEFPQITPLPFLLVPGVRSGSDLTDLQSLDKVDVMRGEETLCVGLQTLGLAETPVVVLTLGSHWKAIQLDAEGRIQSSITSLSGELLEALRTHTILASSVAGDWPDKLTKEAFAAGMKEQRRSGLPRALFCVRLLELKDHGTPEDRFSFLLGALIASDLDPLVARGILTGDSQVIISGHALMANAWAAALASLTNRTKVLTEDETEQAFLAGLALISARSAAQKKRTEK